MSANPAAQTSPVELFALHMAECEQALREILAKLDNYKLEDATVFILLRTYDARLTSRYKQECLHYRRHRIAQSVELEAEALARRSHGENLRELKITERTIHRVRTRHHRRSQLGKYFSQLRINELENKCTHLRLLCGIPEPTK